MTTHPWPRYPRPAILDALAGPEHHVIEASAGTGKTFTLEHLVVDRVLQGADLTRLLVVTFTERAAAELRGRIRALLWRLVVAAERPVPPVTGPAWTLDPLAVQRLQGALARIDLATISTIHAFCQRLLTENAFAHRRLFSQRLTDGQELFAGVFRDFLRTTLKADPEFGELLRLHVGPGGMEADGPVLELEQQLYAAVRFHGQLEPVLDEPAIAAALASLPATLPTGAQVAAAYTGRRQRAKVTAVLDQARAALDRGRARAGIARMLALGPLLDPDGKERVIDYAVSVLATTALPAAPSLLAVLTLLAGGLPASGALLAHRYRQPLIAALRQRKEEQGLFDFDDMLEVVAASLQGPSAAVIKASLRERYDLVLIDEFQDTDPVQWQVFRTLFAEPGCPTRVAVIGDPKQAIYGFRAADVETYLGAREALLDEPDEDQLDARIVRLTQNFRSSERMIAGYNLILAQVPGAADPLFQADPRITYGERTRVSCGDPTVRLVDPAGAELAPIHLLRVDLDGKPPKLGLGLVARFVAEEAERLLAPDGPRLADRHSPTGRALRANDIYVLARKNGEAHAVAAELGARGVPYSFYKLGDLFETDEVADLIDVLAAVVDPFDRVVRARAWLTPFFELGPIEVEAALDVPDDHPLVQRLRTWHDHGKRRDYRRLFAAVIEDSGVARRAALLPGDERPLTNVLRALELLAEEARRRHATLAELVDLLRSWRAGRSTPAAQGADAQPLETERPAVQLMTMHAAKGLEAPVVFLVGGAGRSRVDFLQVFHRAGMRRAWIGKLPADVKKLVEREQRGEHERLLYVALTRARTRMYLPWFVKQGEPAKLQGGYDVLNQRLGHIARAGLDPSLFVEDAPATPAATEADEGARRAALAAWTPAPPLAAEATRSPEPGALARDRRGAIVTSFTQLAARTTHRAPVEVDRDRGADETRHADTPPEQLTSSSVVGDFLHDALEQLDLPRVRAFASLDAFASDPQVRTLVERLADGAGIVGVQRPHAYRMLYATLRSPIEVGTAGTVPCIAGLPRVVRESEFLFPIPEAGHRLLGAPAAEVDAPFTVGRGLVKGFIDVIFEHDGRLYFGDWKSSVLRDPSPSAIRTYVDAQFRWQVVVYGIAVLRMLGVTDEAAYERRFGGLLYFFLREMERTPAGEPTRGVWFERPAWDTVKGWERTLLAHDFGRPAGAR